METLTLQGLKWDFIDADQEDLNGLTTIRCVALDPDSVPHVVYFEGFPCYCWVELPLRVHGRQFRWDANHASNVVQYLKRWPGSGMTITAEFSERRPLYYYQTKLKPMIRLFFNNKHSMDTFTKKLSYNSLRTTEYGDLNLKIWEERIDPVLKFITSNKISHSSWFTVEATKVAEGEELVRHTSRAYGREYNADFSTIKPVSADKSDSYQSKPLVAAVDGEMYSNKHLRMPDKFDIDHCAYLISVIIQRTGASPSERIRYAILYGDCYHIPPEKLTNTFIIKVDSEIDVLKQMGEVFDKHDPDIVLGYNTMGFDYPYWDHRIKLFEEEWPQGFSRFEYEKVIVPKPLMWKSSAYGFQTLYIPLFHGRLSIDLYPLIQRDHKLPQYNLDSVAKHFLGKSKHDVSAIEMFKIYEKMMYWESMRKKIGDAIHSPEQEHDLKEMTRVVLYCIQDSELLLDLYAHLNVWVSLVELSNIVKVPIVDLFTRGQQLRCFSQIYDMTSNSNIVIDKRNVELKKFTGGQVFDPTPGIYDKIICLDFASLYPSIIRAYNICFTTLLPPELNDEASPDEFNRVEIDIEQKNENITSKTDGDEEDIEDSDDDDEENEAPENTIKVKKIINFRKVLPGEKAGILPTLVDKLVKERSAVRKVMETEKDPGKKAILNARQLALKVCANSFFGFLGVQNGAMLPLPEGAMSITKYGRDLIQQVAEYVKKNYNGKLVYGDTDSVMVDINIENQKDCVYWGERLSQEISGVKAGQLKPGELNGGAVHEKDIPGLFPPPLAMEFEKAMRILCLCKKKYMAYFIDRNGNFKVDKDGTIFLLVRGIVLARRDNCSFLRDFYKKIALYIMNRKNIVEVLLEIAQFTSRFFAGKANIEELSIVKSLGAKYKNPNYHVKKFADRLVRMGKNINPGDRLRYIIAKYPNQDKKAGLGDKMCLLDDYKLNPEQHPIDYEYYMEHVICNPIDQLFAAGFSKEVSKLSLIQYLPPRKRNPFTLDKPCLLFTKLEQDKIDKFEAVFKPLKSLYRLNPIICVN